MTNKEYIESKGKCINTGVVGLIEAYIRKECLVGGIEFDDEKIESWLEKIIPDDRSFTTITCREIIEKSIGIEYVGPFDHMYGFDFTIP